ncbi:fibronectin type III domain-containing protein [Olivibacter sp. SDN3]|uniref:fibronectin type III domain-containing protein n=1 Tax=Olivibacter sp. SDN3 TaxID=2764720 RepID=UPI0016514202|nr:fibronectin type III domain-containing protein [Olivibacter sp. SDN3]QNL49147.1 fibronectin type III domain-containing protein [Olivibacter sp. SDN3]
MQNNRQANLGFKRFSDDALATLGVTVITAMADNPHFGTPVPALEDVQILVDDFREKLASTRRGSPLNTSEKNHSRQILEGELKKLAFYVNTVADGALHVILSSGFPVRQSRTSVDIPAIPERLRLMDTSQSGQLRLDFNAVKGAWEYEYRYATSLDEQGEPDWEQLFTSTSSRNNVLAPLEPGIICRVKVRSRNGKGVSDWSEPISRMAR